MFKCSGYLKDFSSVGILSVGLLDIILSTTFVIIMSITASIIASIFVSSLMCQC